MITVLWIWPSWRHGQKLFLSHPLISFPGFCTWLRLLHLGSKIIMLSFHMRMSSHMSSGWALGDFNFSNTLVYNQFFSMIVRPGPLPILALASTLILFLGFWCLFFGHQILVRALKIHHDKFVNSLLEICWISYINWFTSAPETYYHSFIHLLKKYLLNAYYIPGISISTA